MIVSTQTGFLGRKYGLVRAVEMLIEAGYDAIDLSITETDSAPYTDDYREIAERLREMAESGGVRFIQAHAPYGTYEQFMKEYMPHIPRAFEFCSLLGVENIVIHPAIISPYLGNEERAFRLNLDFYKSLAPLAREWGVKIAIENMYGFHKGAGIVIDDIFADPHEHARIFDELGDPDLFTLCLDIGHSALCKREPADAIRVLGKRRLGCLHIHDVNYREDLHTLPGASKLNWQSICEALAEIDYEGAFNLEADGFFRGFLPEHYNTVARFMCDTARVFADKTEALKAEKSR